MGDNQGQLPSANYTNYAGLSNNAAPFVPQTPAPENVTPVKSVPGIITDEDFARGLATTPPTPSAYGKSDPYAWADRYMFGLGHSGYVGPESEDYNAQRQSIGGKWINGVAKMAGNAATTFVSGTVGMVDGLGEMFMSPVTDGEFKFSKFYNNVTDQAMYGYQQKQENLFPNYYTDKEQNSGYNSIGGIWNNISTANFWADKFFKNAGFALGAMGSGAVLGAALGEVPQLTKWAVAANRLFRTGSFADKAAELEKTLAATADLDDINKAEQLNKVMSSPVKMATAANRDFNFAQKFNQGLISVLGSVGESGMEAIQGYYDTKQKLIGEYKKTHDGADPTPDDMKFIEDRSNEGANWRWAMNMVTLSITNNIQFPRLLSNNFAFQKSIYSKEIGDIVATDAEGKVVGDVAKAGQKYAVKSAQAKGLMKIVNPVYQFAKNPIAVSEAVEEGLQYAYETGTQSYEMKKYNGQAANVFTEVATKGFPAMWQTKEGIESILLGGITGKLMDMGLGVRERAETRKHTAEAVESFNKNPIENFIRAETPYMQSIKESAIRGEAINQENAKAVAKQDVNEQRNSDEDFIFNYAHPRLMFGRGDLLKEELQQYHSGNTPFEEVKKALGLPDEVTSEALDKMIDERISQIDTIGQLRDFVLHAHGMPDTKTNKPKYSEDTLGTMMYALFKISSHEERFNKLIQQIQEATGVDMGALYNKRKRAGDDLDTVRNELTSDIRKAVRSNPTLEIDKNGISIFDKVKDLEKLQNDREQYVKDYESLRRRTLDKKPVLHIDGNSSVADIEDFEDNIQNKILIDQLHETTSARALANHAGMALEAIDDGDGDKIAEHLAAVDDLAGKPGAFMYQSDVDYLRSVAGSARESAFERSRREVPQDSNGNPVDDIPGFHGASNEEAVNTMRNNTYDGAFTSELHPDQIGYLENIRAHYNNGTTTIDKLTDIADRFDNTEPRTPLLSELKRKIADKLMESYDAVEQAMNKEDSEDYREIEEVQALLARLEMMKKMYEKREELLKKEAFDGFMNLLDERIKQVKEWRDIVAKRLDQIFADDNNFHVNRLNAQWVVLGINVTGPDGNFAADKLLYDHISSIVGEDVVKKAAEDFHKAVKANEPGAEKHLLALVERLRLADNKELEAVLKVYEDTAKNYLVHHDFRDKLQNPDRYSEITASPLNSPERVISILLTDRSKAYNDYMRHRDVARLASDVKEDIKEGRFDYSHLSADETLTLLSSIAGGQAARSLRAMLNSKISISDIYSSLKTIITQEQSKNNPTPSSKQMISIMDMLYHFYDKSRNASKKYDGIMYLNGGIGTGKTTVVLNYLIKTLSNLESTPVEKFAYLAGDINKVGAKLETAMGITTPQAKSIDDTIEAVHSASIDSGIKVIVVDESARATGKVRELAEAVHLYNNAFGKNLTVYLLGDDNQVTDQIGNENKIGNISTDIKVATTLSTPYRGKVSSINTMQSDFATARATDMRTSVRTYTANTSKPWNKEQGSGVLLGVSGSLPGLSTSQKEAQAIEVMKNRVGVQMNGSPISKVVIVNRGKEQYWKDLLKKNNIPETEFQVMNYFDAQGETFDEAYVDLDTDATDPLMGTTDRLNTAVYTSARGRNFVYLINNAINTKEDGTLEARFLANSEVTKKGAEEQLKRVEEITDELKKVTAPTVKTPEPEEVKEEEEEKEEEKEEEDTEDVTPEKDPKDGDINPDDNNPVPDVIEDEEDEQVIGGGGYIERQWVGDHVFVTDDGQIGINLSYPQGDTLKDFNNISTTVDGEVRKGTPPHMGNDVYIVPIPSTVGPEKFRYGVFRLSNYEDVHQQLGILSNEEVGSLRTLVPGFDEYHNRLKDGKEKIYQPIAIDQSQKSNLLPKSDANTHYSFDDIGTEGNRESSFKSALPRFLQGQIYRTDRLAYKKADNASPVVSPYKDKPLEHLLEIWHKDFFGTTPNAISFENFMRSAKVGIVTITQAEYNALAKVDKNGRIPVYQQHNVPVKVGGTYIKIESKEFSKPQFIPLEGAVLNMNSELHNQLYIDPMRKFTQSARALSDKIKSFVRDEMGMTDEEFKKVWTSNFYKITANGTTYTFHRDDPKDFDTSSDIFNYIAKQLMNWDWKEGNKKHVDNNQTVVDFMNTFFEKIAERKMDESFVTAARELRETHKAYEEQKDDDGNVVKVTLPSGAILNKINLGKVKDATVNNKQRRAQVAMINLAQANGYVTDATGKKRLLLRFENRKDKDRKSSYPIRSAYDLLESNFHSFSAMAKDKEGNYTLPNEDAGYMTAAYNYYEAHNMPAMHMNVYQFKSLLSYLINTRQFDTAGRSLDELYKELKQGNENANDKFQELVDFALGNYSFDRLGLDELEKIFGTEGFDNNTKTQKEGLKVNLPARLSGTRGVNWMSPAVESSTDPINRAKPEDRIGQMLATKFNGVTPSGIQILTYGKTDQKNYKDAQPSEEEDAPAVGEVEEDDNSPIGETPKVEETVKSEPKIKGYDYSGLIGQEIPRVQTKKGDRWVWNTGYKFNKIKNYMNGEGKMEPGMEVMVTDEGRRGDPTPYRLSDIDTIARENGLGHLIKPIYEEEQKEAAPTPARNERASNEDDATISDRVASDEDADDFLSGGFHGETGNKTVTEDEARKYLKSLVPGITDKQIHFFNRMQMLKEMGVDVWGMVRDGAVAFQQNQDDTIYHRVVKHEAFHAIFRYFTNPEQRNKIINAAIGHYGLSNQSPTQVEEFLAQQFDKREDIGFIPRIIRSFFTFLKNIFGIISNREYRIERYFQQIESGAFRTPSTVPMDGAAFLTKFKEHFDNNYPLFHKTWSVLSSGIIKLRTTGVKVNDNGKELMVPLSDNEIIDDVVSKYRNISKRLNLITDYSNMTPQMKLDLQVGSQEDLQFIQKVYGKLSDANVVKGLIHAHYPGKFRLKVTEEEADELENTEGIDEDLRDNVDQNEESRKVQNLSSELLKDDAINPRSTLSEQVKMYLQTITDDKGNTVDKEYSLHTLFNTIKNLPLKNKEEALTKLREAFEKEAGLHGAIHPEWVDEAVRNLTKIGKNYASNKDKQGTLDTVTDTVNKLIEYYKGLAKQEFNPTVKFPMGDAAETLRRMHDMLRRIHASLSKQIQTGSVDTADAVKTATQKIVSLVKDNGIQGYKGNSYTRAVYESVRQMMVAAYSNEYTKQDGTGKFFQKGIKFRDDNTFVFRGRYLYRLRNQSTFDFLKNIQNTISHQIGNTADFTLEDIIGYWKRDKNFNTLAELMNITNNVYTVSPLKLVRKSSKGTGEINYTIEPITDDDISDQYNKQLIENINDILIKKDGDTTIFNPDAFEKTRALVAGRAVKEMSAEQQDHIIKTFLQEAGLFKDDIIFSPSRRLYSATGVESLIHQIDTKIKDSKGNPEDFDASSLLNDSKGYLRDITYSLVASEKDRNMTVYTNGEGKQVFFSRQKSSANQCLLDISDFHDSDKKGIDRKLFVERRPYLAAPIPVGDHVVSFWQLNPINPMSAFQSTRMVIGKQRLFDSHIGGEDGQFVTVYRKENKKDIITRLLVGNFIAPLSQDNLFKHGDKFFNIQPFYVMSDKDRSEGVDMEVISAKPEVAREHYAQMLYQMMLRPLPSYEDNGKRPYDIKGGDVYYSPFRSVSTDEVKALRDKYESVIQGHLKADKNNGIYDAYKQFVSDAAVQKHIDNISEEMLRESEATVKFIQDNLHRNSTFSGTGENIRRKLNPKNAFQLPSHSQLRGAYQTLFDRGIVSAKDMETMSNGKVKVVDGEVELDNYSGTFNNYSYDPGHFLPAIHAMTVNQFVRGHYLNQMTFADPSAVASSVTLTKRMAISQGGGLSFFNMNNITKKENDYANFLVVEDIIMHRNLNEAVTPNSYDPSLHTKFPEGTGEQYKEQLKTLINDLSKMAQLTNPQYKNLLKAYQELGKNEEELQGVIDSFKGLSLNQTKVNDAAGFLTQRAHEEFKDMAGPAMNVQDIMKPLVHGVDNYGVARNSKFAVEVITDRLAATFPAMFDLRFQADFGHLKTSNPEDYNEARQLEEERVSLLRGSLDPESPTRLNPEKELRLWNIYNSSANQPKHFIVPNSAVKFNAPKVMGTYNYEEQKYNEIDHNLSSFSIPLNSVRIQQNPVANPENGAVSLFTQLLYMSNVNGNNYQEMNKMFDAYSEIQKVNTELMKIKYPLVDNKGEVNAAAMVRNMNTAAQLMLDKNKNNEAKFREMEAMKHSVSAVNDPSIVNDVYTQFMSYLQKQTAGVKFKGMKLVQMTPALRSTSHMDELKYDPKTMTAEVYLPDVFLPKMRQAFPGLTDQELLDKVPLALGWRVPSTGINSAVRLKAKGFYPSRVNAIVGPADMHLIMGSDFDVDSLFVLTHHYGNDTIKNKKQAKLYNAALEAVYNGKYDNMPLGYKIENDENGISTIKPNQETIDRAKRLYEKSTGKVKRIYGSIYNDMLRNSMLEQYLNIMGKEANRKDARYPINFETAKSLTDPSSLFNMRAFALSKDYETKWNNAMKNGDLFFNSNKIDELEDLRDEVVAGDNFNVNTPMGYAEIQRSAIGGKNLTGTEANNTKTAAYTTYSVNPNEVISIDDRLAINYDGEEKKTIGKRLENGHYTITLGDTNQSIFEVLQWIVNAVVDNTKEQIAPVMNLTQSTSNAWSGGLLLGMTPIQLQSFMNMPVFREVSDYNRIDEDILNVMRRELLSMLDNTKGRSIEEKYALNDPKLKDFGDTVKKLSDLAELTHSRTMQYEKFKSLDEIRERLKGKDLKDFVAYSLKSLDTFSKLDEVGNAFYKLQSVLGIIQAMPVQYEDSQKYLDNFFSVYKGTPSYIFVPRSTNEGMKDAKYKVYRTEIEKDGEGYPVLKKSFPIKGINLFRIQHFNRSFTEFKQMHDSMASVILKHSPAIENLAIVLSKELKLKLDRNPEASVEKLKDMIMRYNFGLTHFTNGDGTSTPIGTTDEVPYIRPGDDYEFTGSMAFIQRFADMIRRVKTEPQYRSNEFMNRVRFQERRYGTSNVTFRKIQGLEPGKIASLMQAFEDFDHDTRAKQARERPYDTSKWYSPLQIGFLKNAVILNGLKFGSTNYSSLLPVEMKAQLMEQMYQLITAYGTANASKTQTEKIEDTDEKEMQNVPVTTIDLISNIMQNVALKIAADQTSSIPAMRLSEIEHDVATEVQQDENDQFEEGQQPAPETEQEDQPTQKELQKKTRFSHNLKYESASSTFYNYKLNSRDTKRNVNEIYPLLLRKTDFNKKDIIYVRVHSYSDEQVRSGYYRRIGEAIDAKALLADRTAFFYGYDLKEMFPKNIPNIRKSDIDAEGRLSLNMNLPNVGSQLIYVAPNGDNTLERAEVYKVAKTIRPYDETKVKEVQKELSSLSDNQNRYDYRNFQKQRKVLFDKMREAYGLYEVQKVSTQAPGIKAIRQVNGTLTDEVLKKAANTQSLLYSGRSATEIHAMLSLQNSGIDTEGLSPEDIIAAAKLFEDDKVTNCK